jgi:protein-S-isoprenylcysteine O-methyltransferase Ste14
VLSDRLSRRAWRARLAAVVNLCFLGALCLFVAAQGYRVLFEHVFTSVGFALTYTLILGLALIRRRPLESSNRARDWLLAATAWVALLAQPVDTNAALGFIGGTLGLVGAGLTIVSMLSLGRSFGIVAANRGVRTGGAYRLLRHPIYASELIAMAGNLVANWSSLNLVIVLVAGGAIPLRILAEERVLSSSSEYLDYRERVRWRLVPGLY